MRLRSVPSAAISGAVLFSLAACVSNPFGASPLSPQPTRPVTGQTLPPPSPPTTAPTAPTQDTVADAAADAATDAATDTAADATAPVQQAAAFGPAEVGIMSGGWTISDGSGSCSLFMSTTTWTGGYRAVTRGCPSSGLQSVNAWNVVDGKIALKDGSGTEIARLTRVAETRYSGAFSSGGGVSFSR